MNQCYNISGKLCLCKELFYLSQRVTITLNWMTGSCVELLTPLLWAHQSPSVRYCGSYLTMCSDYHTLCICKRLGLSQTMHMQTVRIITNYERKWATAACAKVRYGDCDLTFTYWIDPRCLTMFFCRHSRKRHSDSILISFAHIFYQR
jgi:hypothetical protein